MSQPPRTAGLYGEEKYKSGLPVYIISHGKNSTEWPLPVQQRLKFKKCCGSIVGKDLISDNVIGLPPNQTSASLTAMGLAGSAQQIHLFIRFVAGDPRNAIPPFGTAGQYQVTFVLARPGFSLTPEKVFSMVSGLKGDSHLAINKPAFIPPGNEAASEIRVQARTEDGDFVFSGIPNDRGFLGKIVSKPFTALNRNDAQTKAYRAISGSLSD